MAMFDKTFPTLDCAACILTPKMTAVRSHPNITLWTLSEVTVVEGYVGNYKVTVRRKPRYVIEELCVGCMECIDACVYKQPRFEDEFNQGLSKRKPVYIPFPQATPQVVLFDPETCLQLKKGKCKQTCIEACDRECIDFSQTEEFKDIEVGTIILATGFKPFDPAKTPYYGYGTYPNVYTALEVERLVNASGPTGGEVVLRDGTHPKAVGIIHCVGSRDKKTNVWCSKVCCMYSLKLAHLIKEHSGAEIYNFYIDMRTPFKDYDEFYQRVLEEGANFVRGKVAEITDVARTPDEEGHLVVQVEDTLLGKQRRIPLDMVILSAGLEARFDSAEVAKRFGISCSFNGWFIEKHPKLDPVATMTDGIFIAGCAQGPKDIPASVAQGAAAAARVLGKIEQKEVALEPIRASVIDEKCSGCRICNGLCPFNAISFHEDRMLTEINAALCQGCGTCVAACPAGAIVGTGFSNEQILSQIEGLMLLNVPADMLPVAGD